MHGRGGQAHLHAEYLADLAGRHAVVQPHRANLRAAAAQVAAIGRLAQPRDGLPVQVDVRPGEGAEQLAGAGEVLLVQLAQHVHAEDGAVDLVAVRRLVHMARLRACVALRAVLHRQAERLQVLVVGVQEQLLQALEELYLELVLLFLRLGALHGVDGAEAVERAAVRLGPFGLRVLEGGLQAVLVVRRGQGRQVVEGAQQALPP